MTTNGLVVMTPTSVAKTGVSSTATINADGSVTFGACETLSLNGVFTSDYDNYMIAVRGDSSPAGSWYIRFRDTGSDSSTGYIEQRIEANGTSVVARRNQIGGTYGWVLASYNTQESGATVYVFGPKLTQPTAYLSISVSDFTSAFLRDYAGTHSDSNDYDGITFLGQFATPLTGLLTVFGFNQ